MQRRCAWMCPDQRSKERRDCGHPLARGALETMLAQRAQLFRGRVVRYCHIPRVSRSSVRELGSARTGRSSRVGACATPNPICSRELSSGWSECAALSSDSPRDRTPRTPWRCAVKSEVLSQGAFDLGHACAVGIRNVDARRFAARDAMPHSLNIANVLVRRGIHLMVNCFGHRMYTPGLSQTLSLHLCGLHRLAADSDGAHGGRPRLALQTFPQLME